jgi:sugar phosphate isomerase/epimerase
VNIVCASICYRGWAEDEIAATLQHAPRVGYRLMEIHGPAVWSVESIAALDVARTRETIDASGMRCVGVYPPGWGGKDAAEVSAHARAIVRGTEIAEALGADHVATTGAVTRETSGGLASVIQCAREVVRLLPPSRKVALALEPHLGNILLHPEDFQAVLDAVPDPRLAVCIDTGHFHGAGVDTVAAIRRFAGRIASVHLKDHVGTESVGIGRGEIDLGAVIAALREVRYAGDLTVELEVKDPENLPRYTQEAFVYISGLLGHKLPGGPGVVP